MKCIILVAGYATRLFPLTKDRPKALLDFWGKPILNYIYENMAQIDDIDEVFVVSNSKFYPHFSEWAKTLDTDRKITVIDDGTSDDATKLGAVGDLKLVVDKAGITDDVMVLLGDNLFTFGLKDMYNFHKKVDSDCVCVKVVDDLEELQRIGVAVLDENSKVLDFEEKPKEPKSNKGAFGAYIYKGESLKLLDQYLAEGNSSDAPGYFPAWLSKKKDIYAFTFEGECFDIGTIKSYEDVMQNCKHLFVK